MLIIRNALIKCYSISNIFSIFKIISFSVEIYITIRGEELSYVNQCVKWKQNCSLILLLSKFIIILLRSFEVNCIHICILCDRQMQNDTTWDHTLCSMLTELMYIILTLYSDYSLPDSEIYNDTCKPSLSWWKMQSIVMLLRNKAIAETSITVYYITIRDWIFVKHLFLSE